MKDLVLRFLAAAGLVVVVVATPSSSSSSSSLGSWSSNTPSSSSSTLLRFLELIFLGGGGEYYKCSILIVVVVVVIVIKIIIVLVIMMINNSISNMGSIRNRKIGGVGGRLEIRKPRTLFFVVVVAHSFFIQPTRMVYTHVGTFQHTHTHSSCVECRDTPPPKQTNKLRGVFLLPPKRMYQYIYIYIK